jgi:hypothetical protein
MPVFIPFVTTLSRKRRVAIFKGSTPEVQPWHKHLGDFCGPVILYLRRNISWMKIHEEFETGYDHGFRPKSQTEIIDAWKRPDCDGLPDEEGIFTKITLHTRAAYAHDNYPIPDEL